MSYSLFEVVHERSVKTVAKVLDGRLVVAQDDRRLVVGQLTLGLCVAKIINPRQSGSKASVPGEDEKQ